MEIEIEQVRMTVGGHLFAFDTANLRQPFRAAMVCPVLNRCEKEDYERE